MGPAEAIHGVKDVGEAIGVTPLAMLRFVAAAGWLFAALGWGLYVSGNRGRLKDAKESGTTAVALMSTFRDLKGALEAVAAGQAAVRETVDRAVEKLPQRRVPTSNPGRKPPEAT